ncbi:MAG: glycosyltransferase family 2 protein [Armatimonadetes bacterium]|nr:glycosyltransferase family 2 protein [Armatimonadota bacterium]
MSKVSVIIPILNEEASIGKVIDAIPKNLPSEIICVDNGCTDRSPEIAQSKGARVVVEHRKGYGAAMWAGIQAVSNPDTVVFLDGDYSDYPEEMPLLVDPIARGEADMVVGSRLLGKREPGALPPHSVIGNWIASRMLRLFFGVRCTDLGPFNAIAYDKLLALDMQDRRFGWPMELWAKAAAKGYRILEVPVRYRRRIGKSKITGNLLNSCRAGWMITSTCVRIALCEKLLRRR